MFFWKLPTSLTLEKITLSSTLLIRQKFTCTVVNRALTSFMHGGSVEITPNNSLNKKHWFISARLPGSIFSLIFISVNLFTSSGTFIPSRPSKPPRAYPLVDIYNSIFIYIQWNIYNFKTFKTCKESKTQTKGIYRVTHT